MRVSLQAFNNGVYEISSLSILSKAYVFSKMSTLSLQVHLMKREKVALQTVQENIKYFFLSRVAGVGTRYSIIYFNDVLFSFCRHNC